VSSSDPEHDGVPDAEHPATPEPEPLDVDSAFAAIIAGWADAPTTGSWPAEEDLTGGRHRRVDDPDDEPTGSRAAGRDDSGLSLTSPGGPLIPSLNLPGDVDDDPVEDDSEGFVPPEPPPIPRGDLVSRLAWAGLIVGPAFLVTSAFLWTTAPELLVLGAIGAFVGGFVTLVARMPKHRDDDGDDGAVV
jgi:hypothetical protein